jgi:hypothetical protein
LAPDVSSSITAGMCCTLLDALTVYIGGCWLNPGVVEVPPGCSIGARLTCSITLASEVTAYGYKPLQMTCVHTVVVATGHVGCPRAC